MVPSRLDPFAIWLRYRALVADADEEAVLDRLMDEYHYCADNRIELPYNAQSASQVKARLARPWTTKPVESGP